MVTLNSGVYPTMITPYKDGVICETAVRKLVDWYIEKGCNGIFAVCQSSEMVYLSLEERVRLAKMVVDQADHRICIVASGHVGNSIEEQIHEINAMAKTGVDAVVLVSNRFDLHNDGDEVWIANAEKVLAEIDPDIPLGIYECPIPYKRLLTPKIIDWCIQTGRFRFIKDTCCDPDLLEARLKQLEGTGIMLFNANEQTLHHSLKFGGSGYSGIMANFHPDVLAWLCDNFKTQPEKAEQLSDVLSMMAFTEGPAYPCTAKHYLNKFEGISMDVDARSSDKKRLTSYQKLVVDQMYRLNHELSNWLK